MAQRSCEIKIRPSRPVGSRKRPSSSSKAETSKRAESRPRDKSACGPTMKSSDDLLAKEEHYKLMNAKVEAKTAEVVRQVDHFMREHCEVLSKPLSALQLADIKDKEDSRIKLHLDVVQDPSLKAVTNKKVSSVSQKTETGTKVKELHCKTLHADVSDVDNLAAAEESAELFLANVIRSMEEKMDDITPGDVEESGDCVQSGIAEAQLRVLRAKLRITQEELEEVSSEYYKKDDLNAKLNAKMKEMEEDRVQLQKTLNIQKTQIEKHKASADEAARRCDALQVQVTVLKKEVEDLNRSHKQAGSIHNTTEIRLNRALEEVEKLKTQMNKMNQINKDKISEEQQGKENLLAENKILKKQKEELIVGFKKQLKLIDLLKRQKMHFEAAKLLSFKEDEFLKALDWGKF